VVADNMIMLGSAGDSGSRPATNLTIDESAKQAAPKAAEKPAAEAPAEEEISIEDIPF
jgi:hypothetical protein